MNIGEMFVRVGADTSGLDRGLRGAENRVRGFGTAVGRVNLDRLRGPLTTVAAQLTGLNPALGTLTTTLLSMAAGGGVAVGAIAGFAAIGAAMRKMGEDAVEANKAIVETAKRLDDAARGRAFGGQLQAFEDAVTARTKLRELADQAAPIRAAIGERERLGPLANIFGALDQLREQLQPIEVETALWRRRLEEAERAMEGAIPAIDGITVSVERLKRATLSDFGGPGLPIAGEQARAALAASRATPLPDWVKKALALNLQPMSQGGAGGGPLDNVVGKFRDAVDSFTGGVKDVVQGAFSAEGLANIGANLASQGIGFLAGKALEGIGSLFGGTERAMSKLAQALEQNTRALSASADFLAKRLSNAGLTEDATKIAEVLRGVLDRAAVSDDGRINLREFREALDAAGISMETFNKVAKLLGINIETLSIETLTDFFEATDKATSSIQHFGEMLSNVPEIWNAALGRFRATRAAASGMLLAGAGGGMSIGVVNVYGGVRDLQTLETEVVRRAARGGAPVVRDGNRRGI